jgi:hypothetical protein
VGLISGILTLPLAPLRGTVWVAEQVLEQAERDFYDERAIHDQLLEIDAAREAGTLDAEEAERAEDVLVERMMEGRRRGVGERHG